jgi:hypothetical protein
MDKSVVAKTLGEKIQIVEERLTDGHSRMDRLEQKIDANTAVTEEIRDIVSTAKGFFRVLGLIGNIAKWIAAIGAAVTITYSAWTHK